MGNESNLRENDNNKKMKLAFGLNDRSPSRPRARGSGDRSSGTNVFMDDDDDDEASDDDAVSSDHAEDGRGGAAPLSSSRSRVNRELRREQEALRRRAGLGHDGLPPHPGAAAAAEAAAAAAAAVGEADGSLYDYDGSYDSFKPSELPRSSDKDPLPPPPPGGRKGSSKYVEDLLRAAELRQKEREARLEKKVAKEQAEEAAQDESLLGKDKFVTSAYKRKLQERELWQRDQLAREAQEHEADVTHRNNASLAMSTFYSNLNRNVAMGGGGGGGEGDNDDNGRREDGIDSHNRHESSDPEEVRSGSFLDGFERPVGPTGDVGSSLNRGPPDEGGAPAAGTDPAESERRKLRAHKLEQARARYLERHPDRRREAAS